jgi:hypothetical protein
MPARGLVAAGAAVVLVGSSAITAMPPVAGAALVFTATSGASALRVSESVAGSPGAETLIDGGGPIAQTVLASGGAGTSFASFPYPGETAVAFPGQLAGLAPQLPRLPDYPFYVRADQTDPEPALVEIPGGKLAATASPSEARSTAAVAAAATPDGTAGVGQLEASARSAVSDESVTATATARTSGIAIGPLRIASLVSTATAAVDPAGALTRTSSVRIEGMTLDGQGLAIENGEVVLAGAKAPLPDTGPVKEALAQAGLDIEYLAREETPTGIVGEGFAVRRTHDTPNGPVTVRFAFGQAAASIAGTIAPDLGLPVGGDLETPAASETTLLPEPSPAPSVLPSTEAAPALASSALGGSGSVGGGLAGPDTGGTGLAGDTPAVGDVVPGASETPAGLELSAPPAVPARVFFDTTGSYLAILVAAAAALCLALLVSVMGVRIRWKR